MNTRNSFYSGMAMAVAIGFTILVAWLGLHFHRIMPVLTANPKAKKYSAPSKASIDDAVTSLERLYHLCKFFGMDAYSAKAIAAAGKALSLRENEAATLQAKYYYLKSIEEAQKVADKKQGLLGTQAEIEPLLDAYLSYSTFLSNSGRKSEARQTLRRAKKFVEQHNGQKSLAPTKIQDMNDALHEMNMTRI